MADLTPRRLVRAATPRRRGERDRGQLILVAAFALAVTFVALAIVVNSAIFTENLASRGEGSGSNEALYLRYEVAQSVGDAVASANVYNTTNLEPAVRTGIGDVSNSIERQAAGSGAFVNVSFVSGSIEYGSRIAQNDTTARSLTSSGGAPDWTVAEDVQRTAGGNGTRAFEIQAEKSALATDDTGAFRIVVERWQDDTITWEMAMWRDGAGSDDIVVHVENGAGGTRFCNTTVPDATIDAHVTAGRIHGEPCSALGRPLDPGDTSRANYRFAAGVGNRYNVSIQNGDAIAGNYSLVVNTDVSGSSTLNTGGSRVSPYGTDAVYSLSVAYQYDRPTIAYETRVRVAPGEPR